MSGFWDIYIARSRDGIYYLKTESSEPEDPDYFHDDYPGEVGTESELLDFISKEMNYIELHDIVEAVQGIRGFGKLCRMIEVEFDDESETDEDSNSQEQISGSLATQVRSVIALGLAKDTEEALELLKEAPF